MLRSNAPWLVCGAKLQLISESAIAGGHFFCLKSGREGESEGGAGAGCRRWYEQGLRCQAAGTDGTARARAQGAYHFVDGIEEKRCYMAQYRRPENLVVVFHDNAFEPVETFADERADNRGDKQVLIRGPFHTGLDSEFPPYGGDYG